MNIQEKAEQYARKQWGDYFDSDCVSVYDLTYGEISAQDYTAGYNEAKRWIPVGERLPEIKKSEHWHGLKSEQVIVKLRDGNCEVAFVYSSIINGLKSECFINKSTSNYIKDVIEWREI